MIKSVPIMFRGLFLILSAVAGNSYSQNLMDGLVSCYTFSGNANDGSGNENHGTIHGVTLAADRFGNPNQAYSFNGSTDNRISIPTAPIVVNKDYSFSVWVNPAVIPGSGVSATIVSIGKPTEAFHNGLTLTNHYASAQMTGWTCGGTNIGTPSAVTTFTNTLPLPNTWYHIVMVRNSANLLLYVNGILSGTDYTGGTSPYFYQDNATVMNVGLRAHSIQPFTGIIDDFAIYNRSLTEAEIQILYQQGLPCSVAVTPPPPVTPPSFVKMPLVSDVSLCANTKATLEAKGGMMYRWYDTATDGNLLHEGPIYVTPELSATTDFYVVNIEDGVESDRSRVTVTVNPRPQLSCSFPDINFVNEDVSFFANTDAGTKPYTYTFDFGDGSILSTQQNSAVYKYEKQGNYEVSISVTDANNCSSNYAETVLVHGELLIPNIITYNSDVLNNRLSVFILNNGKYVPYPETNSFTLQVFNRWGKGIFQTTDVAIGWDGRGGETGTYFYLISLSKRTFKGPVTLIK